MTFLVILMLITFIVFIGSFFGAPWIPTRKKDYDRIAQLTDLKTGMTFYDLGSGSADILFYFSKKYNINCTGIEISPFLFFYSKIKSLFYKKVRIRYGNLYKYDISKADVVYVFLLPENYPDLENKFNLELKKGAKLILSCWPFKNRETNKISKKQNCTSYYLYQK
jgi:SAM-dependent methyltransferase